MNIIKDPSHSLKLRTAPRLIETDALGADSLWSADMLYRHLQFLEGLVPQTASFDLLHIFVQLNTIVVSERSCSASVDQCHFLSCCFHDSEWLDHGPQY